MESLVCSISLDLNKGLLTMSKSLKHLWLIVGFFGLILFLSSPFERLLPVPGDGNDLNPLLQDPGLAIHPPILYVGYVGFSVAFAFAIAAMISGNLDQKWARWTRPWTTVSWWFLTLGIALGSWWAYYELGWGGWWFWDPVENASFMPWLVGTALMRAEDPAALIAYRQSIMRAIGGHMGAIAMAARLPMPAPAPMAIARTATAAAIQGQRRLDDSSSSVASSPAPSTSAMKR